jgi:hypothetical protein
MRKGVIDTYIGDLQYDPASGSLYALISFNNEWDVARMNEWTGEFYLLDVLTGIKAIGASSNTFDPDNSLYYILASNSEIPLDGINTFITVDMVAKDVQEMVTLPDHPRDSQWFGVRSLPDKIT